MARKKITFRLSDDLLEKVHEKANSLNISQSEAMRTAADQWASSPTLSSKIDDLGNSFYSMGVFWGNIAVNVLSEGQIIAMMDDLRDRDDSFARSLVAGYESEIECEGDSE